uniref:Ig-like domain-containing protein n=1 Tax=Globodera pallida TaxID=36090 RepID=A0A183CC48_GLOPA
MPGAPRFTQKPSIQQTAQGDLLMECLLEADPPPEVRWQHAGTAIDASTRVQLTLINVSGNMYRANLVIKEPSATDGGAYKCTAANKFGESNANINLNFAGGEEQKASSGTTRGPTFVGKPRIIPRDGGALILMECKVKSSTRPTVKWSKDGAPLSMGSLYQDVFADLGDGTFLCQLEIRRPTAVEAGQYRCNIRNDQGETNANLKLDFQQEEVPSEGRRSKTPSRPGTPSKKHREGTPSERRRHKSKSREGSPRKHIRSRTATPTQEVESGSLKPPGEQGEKSREPTPKKIRREAGEMETLPPTAPKEKSRRSRSKSPAVQAGPEAHKRQPVVTEPLKSQIAHTGETVKLECELQCHTSTKITWSKDGKTISQSSEYASAFDGRVARLTISNMTETKSGLYKCLANSDFGETQTSAMVKWEMSEAEKKELEQKQKKVEKMELDTNGTAKQKKRRIVAKKEAVPEQDQMVPEKRVQIHVGLLPDPSGAEKSGSGVRFKRLKFGTKQFVDEATNQASQIDDVSEEEAEAKNEFSVDFGAGGKATINGQTSTCSDSHVDRNFDLYNKYFNEQNEEQSSASTSGTHN